MTPQVCRHLIDDPNLKPNTQFIPKPYQLSPSKFLFQHTIHFEHGGFDVTITVGT